MLRVKTMELIHKLPKGLKSDFLAENWPSFCHSLIEFWSVFIYVTYVHIHWISEQHWSKTLTHTTDIFCKRGWHRRAEGEGGQGAPAPLPSFWQIGYPYSNHGGADYTCISLSDFQTFRQACIAVKISTFDGRPNQCTLMHFGNIQSILLFEMKFWHFLNNYKLFYKKAVLHFLNSVL